MARSHRPCCRAITRHAAQGVGTVATVPGPIRVLVCDDQALIRAGYVTIFSAQPDLEVVGEADDGAEAVACRVGGGGEVVSAAKCPVAVSRRPLEGDPALRANGGGLQDHDTPTGARPGESPPKMDELAVVEMER